MLASVATFLSTIQQQAITVLDLPTSYWHEMTARMVDESLHLPALRLVIIGGERAMPERLAMWHKHIGDRVRLMNGYGPTEATVCATICELPAATYISRAEVSIGRPMNNVRSYILDPYLQLVPSGVTGELCLGGACLARGYCDQPDLTAERFIPNPFSVEPGERLYKTGDLARYRRDGQMEFVGRVDGQVKVRGYRVELGEIESALNRHSAVSESIVMAREDIPGDKRLVAYVVNGTGEDLVSAELRKHLNRTLPDYMLPSAIVVLDKLPLTASGKIDRRALPPPGHERPALELTFTAPCTDEEEKLAKIWCDVLNLDQVGVDDNFFELGGHSLLGTQVVSRVRDVFRVELPLRSLFETPTVSGLAATISELRTQPTEVQATAIIPQPRAKTL
jgi:acyl-coenzyme A synthetase/AMP-(fatty) acid ligase/acyl carrier protein